MVLPRDECLCCSLGSRQRDSGVVVVVGGGGNDVAWVHDAVEAFPWADILRHQVLGPCTDGQGRAGHYAVAAAADDDYVDVDGMECGNADR